MGGICSRKGDQQVVEDGIQRGVSRLYLRSGSSKWLRNSFPHPAMETKPGGVCCPSLMELCVYKICEVHPCFPWVWLVEDFFCLYFSYMFQPLQNINKYNSFSKLPRDISQQIFNELIFSHGLTDASVEAFRDCALQVILCGWFEH